MRKRILINTSSFPGPQDHGSPRFVLDLAYALQAHFDVTILAPAFSHDHSADDLEVQRYNYFWPRQMQKLAHGNGMPTNIKRSKLAALQIPSLVANQMFALKRVLSQRSFDLVNSHWLVPQGWCSAWIKETYNVPHVATAHGGDVNMLLRFPLGSKLAKFIVNRSDAIITAGSELNSRLQTLVGTNVHCDTRPMGVNPYIFDQQRQQTLSEDSMQILFIGRLVEGKGLFELIDCFSRLLEPLADLRLSIIGDGPDKQHLETQVLRLGIADKVEFWGQLPHSQIAGHLATCKLLVVPSKARPQGIAEGMPTVIMEGLACGATIVASDVGSIRDVIRDGHNGFLCKPNDADALEACIKSALNSDLSPIRKAAAQTAKAHTWNEVAKTYTNVFERVWRNVGEKS